MGQPPDVARVQRLENVREEFDAHLRQDFQRQGARLLSGHVVKARRAARPRHAHSRAPSLSTAPPSIAAVNLQNRPLLLWRTAWEGLPPRWHEDRPALSLSLSLVSGAAAARY